jgi:hypothetical protein
MLRVEEENTHFIKNNFEYEDSRLNQDKIARAFVIQY